MTELTASYKVSINGDLILALARANGIENIHQLHIQAGTSWPTTHKYLTGEPLSNINVDILFKLLIEGCGLTIREIEQYKISDFFCF